MKTYICESCNRNYGELKTFRKVIGLGDAFHCTSCHGIVKPEEVKPKPTPTKTASKSKAATKAETQE